MNRASGTALYSGYLCWGPETLDSDFPEFFGPVRLAGRLDQNQHCVSMEHPQAAPGWGWGRSPGAKWRETLLSHSEVLGLGAVMQEGEAAFLPISSNKEGFWLALLFGAGSQGSGFGDIRALIREEIKISQKDLNLMGGECMQSHFQFLPPNRGGALWHLSIFYYSRGQKASG